MHLKPLTSLGNIFARLRHVLIKPYDRNQFDGSFAVPVPQRGRQTDFRLGWNLKQQRPWRNNAIHPLDGSGISMSLTGSEKILGSDVNFLTADFNSYNVFPAIRAPSHLYTSQVSGAVGKSAATELHRVLQVRQHRPEPAGRSAVCAVQ